MFNLKNFKIVKELTNNKSQINWLKFTGSTNPNKKELLNTITAEKSFIKEDQKLRATVEEMLKQELGITRESYNDYDFLVDSVIYKLKKQEMGEIPEENPNKN